MNTIEYKIHVDKIIERIEKARLSVSGHHIVKVVAVSKYYQSDAVEKLYGIGQRAFGESRVQDLETKTKALDKLPIEWHFIGNLQKNKINKLIPLRPFLFHGLDSLELAHALDMRLKNSDESMDCLLQINAAKEESKHGVSPDEAIDIYMQIQEECSAIKLKGVMSIGAHSDDKRVIAKSFKTTHDLFDSLGKSATICSMGMSGDFEMAIEYGSNMVRLGRIMFEA